jgi:hypothetical protein
VLVAQLTNRAGRPGSFGLFLREAGSVVYNCSRFFFVSFHFANTSSARSTSSDYGSLSLPLLLLFLLLPVMFLRLLFILQPQ